MKKPNLHKGRIYLKDGVWVVQYKTTERVRGGSPKQLGSYKLQPKVNYVSIRKEDIHNLKDPYDQGKETCFELILINEIENGYKNQPSGMVGFVAQTTPVWYAKLWPTSKMAQDLQYYLETTPQEKIDEDWKKVEELDLVGPTVEEFLNINNMKYETKPHKIFIKGKKYKSDKTTVLCTKTTCNYSTECFQGVVVESKEYSIGSFSKDWVPSVFEEVIE